MIWPSLFQRLIEWIRGSHKPVSSQPEGTLRRDFRRWQEWEEQLEASRRSLTEIVDVTGMAARQAGIPQPEKVGLVAQALREVTRPYPRKLLQVHQAITIAFAALGHHRRNRTPAALSRELEKYGSLIEQRRQQYQQLHQRLTLVLTLLQEVAQKNPWTEGLSLQLLLEHPKIFQTLMNIERWRWENQQICIKRLRNGFQNRLIIGKKWNVLLKNKIYPHRYHIGRRILNEIEHQFYQSNRDDINVLKHFHTRLDTPLLNCNRQAVEKLINIA